MVYFTKDSPSPWAGEPLRLHLSPPREESTVIGVPLPSACLSETPEESHLLNCGMCSATSHISLFKPGRAAACRIFYRWEPSLCSELEPLVCLWQIAAYAGGTSLLGDTWNIQDICSDIPLPLLNNSFSISVQSSSTEECVCMCVFVCFGFSRTRGIFPLSH